MRPPLRRHPSAGFSVLDLVIVFVILAVLGMIAIPYLTKRKERQYTGELTQRLAEVQRAQRTYFEANRRFAPDAAALGLTQSAQVTVTIGGTGLAAGTGWHATATHSQQQGRKCYAGFGIDTVIGEVTTKSGEIKCQ
jgi:type II secretory pathway pseudopilin PulG